MPKAEFYRPYLSAHAAEFLFRSPRRKQRHLLAQIEQLGKTPFGVADYTTRDEDGRETSHLHCFSTVISYSFDHAARLVLILELGDVE